MQPHQPWRRSPSTMVLWVLVVNECVTPQRHYRFMVLSVIAMSWRGLLLWTSATHSSLLLKSDDEFFRRGSSQSQRWLIGTRSPADLLPPPPSSLIISTLISGSEEPLHDFGIMWAHSWRLWLLIKMERKRGRKAEWQTWCFKSCWPMKSDHLGNIPVLNGSEFDNVGGIGWRV